MASASATARAPPSVPMTGCLLVQAATRESLEVLRLAGPVGVHGSRKSQRQQESLVSSQPGPRSSLLPFCFRDRRDGRARIPDHSRESAWACRRSSCRRRTPDWLSSASVFDADARSFDVLLGGAEHLRSRDDGAAREQAWRAMCREAPDRYGERGLAALG
ncbi:MAG TPA: hypothetical protein VLW50_25655 [Streptosporangiaceae bacterium]|nr:hypothetical protein [Streptosporangiaceae bacterium]